MSEIQEEVGLLNIDKEDTSQQDQQETVPHKIEEQSARKTVGEALEGVAEESAQDALEKPDYISDKHWDVKNGIKIEELAKKYDILMEEER